MNDDQILMRGGTEEDVAKYARCNGADLTPDDMKNTKLKEHPTSAAATCSASLTWKDTATRAGWWVVIMNDSKKLDVMEVRERGRGRRPLYGRLPHDGNWWHIAHMLNGRVAGPFKSRKAAYAAMTPNDKLTHE